MRVSVIGFVLLAILISADRHAYSDTGPYVVRVPYKGPRQIEDFQRRGYEILAMNKDGSIDLLAEKAEVDYLFSLGQPASVVQTADMVSTLAALDENLGLYHTYAEMEAALTNLELTYPTLAQLSVIGTSLEGRNIYALKISDNATTDEAEPEVVILGNHHARELMSVDIPLRFATYLLENYGIDGTVTARLNALEIYFVPMINPDGHVYVQNNHGGSPGTWWRKNRRDNGDGSTGVDLNRNYGYQWGYNNSGSSPAGSSILFRGPAPFSEPETQAVRDFCNAHEFTVGFSYHSYGELLLFPWGYVNGYTPDHEVFVKLGMAMTASNGYRAGNAAMGTIYNVNGDADDWAYGEDVSKPSFLLFTPEVNSLAQGGFGPADTLIQPTFDLLLPMNMKLLEYGDNPYRIIGPRAPTQHVVNESWAPNFVLSWSGNDPLDPNPVTSYEITEYTSMTTIAEDDAEAASPLWKYDGFTQNTARSHNGAGAYYSGAVNSQSHTLEMAEFFTVTPTNQLFTVWLWYDIEGGWDYAFLEVSTDGFYWQPIIGSITTVIDPNGNNPGHGITGSSGGWIQASWLLMAYLGQDIRIRFAYNTDGSVLGEGLYVDQPGPVTTYATKSVIEADVVGATNYVVVPDTTGDFTYVIRAKDAQGDFSPMSNSRTVTVSTATGTADGTPPQKTELGANVPNPFNPTTDIPYVVGSPNSSRSPVAVRLTIYNVAGQRVKTLINHDVAPGTYRITWTGQSDTGAEVPSGVYFARLVVGSEPPQTRKLILLK
jgi:hypothetical protein